VRESLEALYKVRKGAVDIIDVPELGYVMVDGLGAPNSDEFADAVQALYAVSYGAHFMLKKRTGEASKVLPLEALWSVGGGRLQDRDDWQWRAMIAQPDPVDAEIVNRCVEQVRSSKNLPALDRLRYERWAEGRCAQILHVGPYAAESPTIIRLHDALAAAGYRPRGRHHEIYLGDPRRSAPEKLRTILRQPIEPAAL